MAAHTTDCVSTFIEVAEDCPVDHAQEPPSGANPTIAALHYQLISEQPFARTSDDVIFAAHALRRGVAETDAEREAFFSKGHYSLRRVAAVHNFSE